MLTRVRVPVLFTHHFRAVEPVGDILLGGSSDVQAREVRRLIETAGQPVEYRSFPDAAHFLHAEDPELYATTL